MKAPDPKRSELTGQNAAAWRLKGLHTACVHNPKKDPTSKTPDEHSLGLDIPKKAVFFATVAF